MSAESAETGSARCNCGFWKEAVLTLDGGGMRGYSSLLILGRLMDFIQDAEREEDRKDGYAAESDGADVPLPCHYFDFMVGTSTGGLIAIMLGRMRMSVDQCLAAYAKLGKEVFGKKRRLKFNQYSYRKLEKVIKETIDSRCRDETEDMNPEDRLLRDPADGRDKGRQAPRTYCRVAVVATKRTDDAHVTHLFRSYHNPTNPTDVFSRDVLEHTRLKNLTEQSDVKIWQAARATSAAPHFFKVMKINLIEYVDGGIADNNPSAIAWGEANSMHRHRGLNCSGEDDGIGILVSIGTGRSAPMNVFSDGNLFHQIGRIFSVAMQKLTDPEKVHEHMRLHCRHVYHRFNVRKGLENMKLDECKISKDGHPKTLERIGNATADYIKGRNSDETKNMVHEDLKRVARILVQHRRGRCAPDHGRRFRGLSEPGPLDKLYVRQMSEKRNIVSGIQPPLDDRAYRSHTGMAGSRSPVEVPSNNRASAFYDRQYHPDSQGHRYPEMPAYEHPAQLPADPPSQEQLQDEGAVAERRAVQLDAEPRMPARPDRQQASGVPGVRQPLPNGGIQHATWPPARRTS